MPDLQSLNKLIEKNIIAVPIKTVVKRDGIIIGGECKDFQLVTDIPMLKSVYKIKNTASNIDNSPIVNSDTINYLADKYKEGEILTYDEHLNPQHVRINDCQDRLYVWGYGGRYLIAIIENMDSITFNTSATLKSAILSLGNYKKIETVSTCNSLRNINMTIRNLLPDSAHITTFTYDPYYGITSEMDDSNSGTIFTYDSFGRLSAKYDANFKKTEEYDYNYYLQ